jgi:hypothetical protein
MMNLGVGAWREIAERASKETDSRKLMALIDELCREMDRADRPLRSASSSSSPRLSSQVTNP